MAEFLGALFASLLLTGVSIPILRQAQFMDVPNHRSSHTRPTPRGGGVAVVIPLVLGAVVFADLQTPLLALVVATMVLAAVGLVDDLRSLPSTVRLLAQVLAAVCLSAAMLSSGDVSWWWLPVLVVVVAGYVNAYNFMDGVNGISALTAAVVGLHWAWVGADQGHELIQSLGLLLAGAVLGFLPWNSPRAKVFLGDVGSYGIGVFIVGLSVLAVASGISWVTALAPLVIYGADTGWVLVKRYRGGRSLTEAHREHVYQRLVDGGWTHAASAALCAAAGAVVCLTVLAASQQMTWWLPFAVAVVVLGYLAAPALQRERVLT